MTARGYSDPVFPARLFLRAAALVTLGSVLGLAANLVSPRRIPWVEDWGHYIEALAYKENIPLAGLSQTRALIEEGRHIVFDARPAADYDAGHIPGALPLPYEEFDLQFEPYAGILTPQQAILSYCSGVECDDALLLLVQLRGLGFTNVVLFAGGWEEWSREEAP